MTEPLRSSPIHHKVLGEGRPVVVLHGLTLDHRGAEASLEPVFRNRAGWKRIYLDLPGHGDSPAADWIHSNDDMAEAVASFIDDALPGEPFALVGQSYGAYIVRGVMHHLSDRVMGLMLWVAASYPREERRLPSKVTLREDPSALAGLTGAEKDAASVLVVQGPEGVEVIKTLLVPAAARSNEQFLNAVSGTAFTFHPEGAPFSKPTLVVCGRQDSIVGYRDQFDLLDAFPRATFAALDYAGHLLGLSEQNDLFRELVRDWLTRMENASST